MRRRFARVSSISAVSGLVGSPCGRVARPRDTDCANPQQVPRFAEAGRFLRRSTLTGGRSGRVGDQDAPT